MQDKKVQWIDVDEEEQQRDLKPRVVVEEIKRKIQIPNPDNPSETKEIEQTVKITKRIFPIRKQVKERKNFKKFGEVADIPQGTNKQGEVIQEKNAIIETLESQNKQEIDIVTKIKGLNTDVLREKRLQQEMQDVKLSMFDQPEEKPSSKIDQWAQQTQRNIKISNIIFDVVNAKEEEDAFKEEVQQHLIRKQVIKQRRPYSLKLVRQKFQDSGKTNLYLAFLSSNDQGLLEQIYKALEDFQYGFAVVQVQWSQTLGAGASQQRKKGGKYR